MTFTRYSTANRWLWAALLAAALGVHTLAFPTIGAAQTAPTEFNEIDATPKGAVGLGLIGAELGMLLPALVGLHQPWAFLVFPATGGAAGAVAGHFLLDQGVESPGLSIAALGVGVALLIPTLIATLSLTAYDPEREASARSGGTGTQQATQGQGRPAMAVRTVSAPSERLEGLANGGLMQLSSTGWRLELPMLAAVPVFTQEDVRQFGLQQRSELRLGLVSGTF